MSRRALESGEICIVHLSDLHFEENRYKPFYDALIEDLKVQLRNDKYIVLIITGDIATKGKVAACHKEIIAFFRKLAGVVTKGRKLLSLEIIPGNHDVERPTILNKFHNVTFCHDSREYDRLHKSIYKEFKQYGIEAREKVGVSYFEYKEKSIAFVRLDTSAFATLNEWRDLIKEDFAKNKQKLWRGKFQGLSIEDIVDKLKGAFEKVATDQQGVINNAFKRLAAEKRKTYLTFALSHHPLTLLNTTGFDNLADILFKRSLYFVDAMVCGHMHKAQLYYTMENAQQKIMLMSGVGWQESQSTVMRYSIYRLCLERNTCQVNIRKTTEGREFRPDDEVGPALLDEFGKSEQFTFPLKSTQIGSVIYLAAKRNELTRGLFVDQETIALLPEVERCLQGFRQSMVLAAIGFCRDLSKGPSRAKIASDEILTMLRDGAHALGDKNRKRVSAFGMETGIFCAFLSDLCKHLVQKIAEVAPLSISSDPSGKKYYAASPLWRVHWRSYEAKSDAYVARYHNESGKGYAAKPAKIKWGGLIEGSFKQKNRMMINSSVPGLNKHRLGKWSDFLTMCPAFLGSNTQIKQVGPSAANDAERPLVSIGISFRAEDFDSLQHASRILYLLEYLNVNRIVEECIERIITMFGFDKDCVGQILLR